MKSTYEAQSGRPHIRFHTCTHAQANSSKSQTYKRLLSLDHYAWVHSTSKGSARLRAREKRDMEGKKRLILNWLYYNGNSAWRKLHQICWEIPSYSNRKRQREKRTCWKSPYQVWTQGETWPRLMVAISCTNTHGGLIFHHNDLFSWTVYTLKTKTAGLKMGPCHSLLGVNLLCPQSCFSLSYFSPFPCVIIAHWIWSSQCATVFRRIQLLPKWQ